MNIELINVFFIVGMSVLWRLGGSVKKEYRRFGAPVLLFIYSIIIGTNFIFSLVSAGALILVTHLPITLIGSEEKDNLFWIIVLGQLFGATLIPFSLWDKWLVGIIGGIVFGGIYSNLIYLSVFSNYKFKWSYVEILFGATYAISVITIRSLNV